MSLWRASCHLPKTPPGTLATTHLAALMGHLWHCLQHNIWALLEVQAPDPADQRLAGTLVKAELLLERRFALCLPCSRQRLSLQHRFLQRYRPAAQISTVHDNDSSQLLAGPGRLSTEAWYTGDHGWAHRHRGLAGHMHSEATRCWHPSSPSLRDSKAWQASCTQRRQGAGTPDRCELL